MSSGAKVRSPSRMEPRLVPSPSTSISTSWRASSDTPSSCSVSMALVPSSLRLSTFVPSGRSRVSVSPLTTIRSASPSSTIWAIVCSGSSSVSSPPPPRRSGRNSSTATIAAAMNSHGGIRRRVPSSFSSSISSPSLVGLMWLRLYGLPALGPALHLLDSPLQVAALLGKGVFHSHWDFGIDGAGDDPRRFQFLKAAR